MKGQDFTVWMNERYNQTKEEFESGFDFDYLNNLLSLTSDELKRFKTVTYEERSCTSKLPNVDYDKLFVGARLYMNSAPFNSLSVTFDEIEVTHLYGGVIFFKFLEGKHKGEEDYISKESLAMQINIYPKIVMKPACIDMVCDCDKTIFKNW